MKLENKVISWMVLLEDKNFLEDIAKKEGKQKWKIFNEARIALEEKRAREEKILREVSYASDSSFSPAAVEYTKNSEDRGSSDGQGKTPANHRKLFNLKWLKVR